VLIGSKVPLNFTKKVVWDYEFNNRRRVVFKLLGFWSEANGKLCMVGTGEIQASQLDQVSSTLSVVLKLDYPKVSKITTSIIEGSIESLDKDASPTHFEPISLLAYAQKKYEYTMSKQAEESCAHLPQEESVESDSTSICSNLVKVMRNMIFTSSDLIDFLEFRFLSTSQIVCSDAGKVHLSMILSNENKPFSPSDGKAILPGQSLVAEGVWDHHNSKLCLSACRVTDKENNPSVIGECSLSLSFWFPATFSLKQRSTMVGRIWNTSDVSNNNANKIVSLYSIDSYIRFYSSFSVPGLKYEYTEVDKARKNCKTKNFSPKKIGKYPDAQSHRDKEFHLSIKDLTNGRSAWGDAKQISIGETYHGSQFGGIIDEDSMYTIGGRAIQSSSSLTDQNRSVWDVGYSIQYKFWDTNYEEQVDISAEGIYNSTAGTLCLVGCRKQGFSHNHQGKILNNSARINDKNLDCTFFIQLQFPPLDSKQNKGTGTIFSTRAKQDPMYFEPLEVTFNLMYTVISRGEYDRMDAEIIMVIISLTILCACSYVQLRHVRKYSTIRPLMSITMLVVLTVGCMVSLILKTEALVVPSHSRHVFLQSGGWIDTTNTIARLITMVALIICYRLLQLAWGSRSKEESAGTISRSAEKKCLIFCVPLYIVGALVAWYVHSNFFKFRRTILEDLARYLGLLVDNFLLPQIIFNMFSQSKEKVLSPFFYFGVTAVRAVPHIYNAYRAWWYPEDFYNPSYIYANHDEDYYSTLIDIVIPFEGLLFVLLVYLQQRFGGRCFLPKRFKRGSSYAPIYDSNI
jgi:Protein of unknown function (DUF2921)